MAEFKMEFENGEAKDQKDGVFEGNGAVRN